MRAIEEFYYLRYDYVRLCTNNKKHITSLLSIYVYIQITVWKTESV